jgi:hypothetical protein
VFVSGQVQQVLFNRDGLSDTVTYTDGRSHDLVSESKTTAEMGALFRSILKAYIGARPRAHVHSTSSDASTVGHVAIAFTIADV